MRSESASFTKSNLTLRNGQSGRPLVSKNVKTDRAVGVDIGVVDLGGERDLGRLEGVVGGEGEGARPWSVCSHRPALSALLTGRRHRPSRESRSVHG